MSQPAHTALAVLGVRFARTLQYLVNSGTSQQPREGEQGLHEEPPPSWIWSPEVLAAPPTPQTPGRQGPALTLLIKVSLQLHEAPGPAMLPSPGFSTEALPGQLWVPW